MHDLHPVRYPSCEVSNSHCVSWNWMYDLHGGEKKNGQRSHSHGGMFGSNDSPPMIFLASSLQFSGVNSAEKFHDISIHQHHFF